MRIDYIEFEGFKASNRRASVEFSSQNVTVIFGDNGCGKTTFLKAMNAFLSQDETSLKSLGVKKIRCHISEDDVKSYIEVAATEEGFDWSSLENSSLFSSKSLSLGVERGISVQPMNIDPDMLTEFFIHSKWRHEFLNDERPVSFRKKIVDLSEELSVFLKRRNSARIRNRRPEIDYEKNHLYLQSIKIENIEELLFQRYRIARHTATRRIQNALFDTISVAIALDANSEAQRIDDIDSFSARLIESKARIIEALDDGEENNFKNSIVRILSEISKPNDISNILERPLLSQLFQNMIDELEVEKLLLSSINLFVDRFNSYLIDNKKLVINDVGVHIDINGVRHGLNDLSSGERHILTFLVLVLFVGAERNFLIIDEPEISLNIKWQRELMSLFSILLPDTQIIVASHSPALAKRNPDSLCAMKVGSF